MSTSVAEQFAEHVDSLKVNGKVKTDQLAVGSKGTVVGAPWTQASLTLFNGTLHASGTNDCRYFVLGKTVFWTLTLNQSSAGSVSAGNFGIRLPIDASVPTGIPGSGFLFAGSDFYFAVARFLTTTTINVQILTGGTTVGPALISNTLAGPDNATFRLELTGMYEIA